MADKQLWQVVPVANDVKNDDGVIIGGQTAGTRYAPLTLIANFVHNLWAAFVNALTAKTSFASGDKIPVVNGSTATAMEADSLLNLTSNNALEEVGGAKKEVVGTDIPSANAGYIKIDGSIASSAAYRYSDKIRVFLGQQITLTAKSPSVNAANMAVYNADGSVSAVYHVSQITDVETFTHTIGGSEAYVLLSCSNDYASLLHFNLSATHLFEKVDGIDNKVTAFTPSFVRVGKASSSYVGTDIPSANAGYIKTDGDIASSTAYRYSNKISVAFGQRIVVYAKSPSVGAANMAVYNADGSVSAVYHVSQTTSVETFTHTIGVNEAYIRLSCSNNDLANFSASISAVGLEKDSEELNTDVIPAIGTLGEPSETITGANLPDQTTGYIARDGSISSSGAYRVSGKISVDVGKTITLTAKSPSVNAVNMAVYNADGSVSAVYHVSQTTSVETFTHTMSGSEAYIRLSCYNDYASLLSAVISPTGLFKTVDDLTLDVANKFNDSKSLSNIFDNKPFYHHFDPEVPAENMGIPSQTLLDVELAKALGNTLIEVNTHACSDGVLVCKHGNVGKLGLALKTIDDSVSPSDLAAMSFNSVTSTWLREKVVYDGFLPKYCVSIPTLDEVCSKCKELSLMVKIDSLASLTIARKYLPDDMIFTSNITTRGDFKGVMELVKGVDDIDTTIAKAKKLGTPCAVCVASGSGMSDISDLPLWNKKIHEAGLLSEIVYNTTNQGLYALANGVDSICSTNRQINLFEVGNILNVTSLDDSNIGLSYATYDDTNDEITIVQGGSIYINFPASVKAAKVCVSICYDGTITASSGIDASGYNLHQYESNGEGWVSYAVAVLPNTTYRSFSRALEVYAIEETIIKGLRVAISSL